MLLVLIQNENRTRETSTRAEFPLFFQWKFRTRFSKCARMTEAHFYQLYGKSFHTQMYLFLLHRVLAKTSTCSRKSFKRISD